MRTGRAAPATVGGLVVAGCTTGGAKLLEVESLPGGLYGVELRRGADDGADYEHWFITERFDPE